MAKHLRGTKSVRVEVSLASAVRSPGPLISKVQTNAALWIGPFEYEPNAQFVLDRISFGLRITTSLLLCSVLGAWYQNNVLYSNNS